MATTAHPNPTVHAVAALVPAGRLVLVSGADVIVVLAVLVVLGVEVVVVVAVEVVVVVMLVFDVVVDASTLLLSRHNLHLQNRKTNYCGNQIMS